MYVKFKKVCALLCSGMCVLGTKAGANEGQKVDSKGVLRMRKKKSDFDDFINKEIEQAEKGRREGWLVGGESLFFGARLGNRTGRAKSEGRLSALNNPKVIKMFKESNLDFFRRESKSKEIHSNLLYAGRWILPLLLVGLGGSVVNHVLGRVIAKKSDEVLKVLGTFYSELIDKEEAKGEEKTTLKTEFENYKSEFANADAPGKFCLISGLPFFINVKYRKNIAKYSEDLSVGTLFKGVSSSITKIFGTILVDILAAAAVMGVSVVSLASVLNYYSQKLQGQSDEFLRIGDEIESNRAGVSVLKAVISKNTETVDKKKSKRRTLNQNPKGEKIAIQSKKRIKMGARKVSKGAFSKNKLDVRANFEGSSQK